MIGLFAGISSWHHEVHGTSNSIHVEPMGWWSINLMGPIMDDWCPKNLSDWKILSIKPLVYWYSPESNSSFWKKIGVKNGWLAGITHINPSDFQLGNSWWANQSNSLKGFTPFRMGLGEDSTHILLCLLGMIACIIKSEWLSGYHSWWGQSEQLSGILEAWATYGIESFWIYGIHPV